MEIKKGDFIFTIEGRIKRGNYHWSIGERWIQIGKYIWIAPFRKNPSFYINHSCNPSAGINDSIKIVAMRDIKKGEEVTYDYSTSESEEGWSLECHCGDENCRQIIRSYEFLPTELKLKYRNFISEYLKKEDW